MYPFVLFSLLTHHYVRKPMKHFDYLFVLDLSLISLRPFSRVLSEVGLASVRAFGFCLLLSFVCGSACGSDGDTFLCWLGMGDVWFGWRGVG